MTKYDLLVCDTNGDKDLTNDPQLSALKDLPSGFTFTTSRYPTAKAFDYVQWKPGGQERSIRFLPWMRAYGSSPRIYFTSASFRGGRIKIGGVWHEAILRPQFGAPVPRLMVREEKKPSEKKPSQQRLTRRWQTVQLGVLHHAQEGFCTITLSPEGDKVTISPYRGEFGEFRVSAKGGDAKKRGVAGALVTKERAVVWLGEPGNYYTQERPHQCRLPVGNYQPSYLYAERDDLVVLLSANNRYPVDLSKASGDKKPHFGITISKETPFEFAFASKPTVRFTSPASKGSVVRRGSRVVFKALLLDPKLDVMVRGLQDTAKKTGTRRTLSSSGEIVTLPRYASLDPIMTITNSSGKEVASGKMPFG
jgi:hypothetical protein